MTPRPKQARRLLLPKTLCAALAAVLVACGAESSSGLKLDGSPRVPDDEGIATMVSRNRIELDGKRRYRVDDDFVSFSTYNGEIEPMVSRKGQYVQLGLRDDTALWMAGIAAVVRTPEPAVYYIGRLKSVDGERLVFADGTVLRRKTGLRLPPRAQGRRVQVQIDPGARRVVELVLA